jgi:GNAT superfamily N-acetyltransferase
VSSIIEIRDAGDADVEFIWSLARDLAIFEELESMFVASIEDFREAMFATGGPAKVIIAEINGEPVGMALFVMTFSTFLGKAGIWLEDLFVSPHARRRGVARALLGELRRRSPGRVEFEVLEWNQGAIDLYNQAGASPQSGWIKYRMQPGS